MAESQDGTSAGAQPGEDYWNPQVARPAPSSLRGVRKSNSHDIPIRVTSGDGTSNGSNVASPPNHQAPTATATAPEPSGKLNNNVEEDASDREGEHGEIFNLPPPMPIKKKKKKNKGKPASKRGLDKPTGFEGFFADTPLTPNEHAEELELYDPDLPFVDRILTAIARFEHTRRMSNERRDILYKYLSYGGVQCGPNMFQGGQDLSNMNKNTIAQILSNASVTEETRNLDPATSLYAVDFLGCMKGFLSRRGAYLYGFEKRDQVDLLTSTLERFMDYLLQHDVCPEYSVEVLVTRNFCRRDAGQELWDVAEASRWLPGDFNKACSTLFDGTYARNYDAQTCWNPELVGTESNVFVGIKPEEANQILHFGVAGAATEDVFAFYLEAVNGNKTLEVVSVEENAGFEITRIEPPSPECQEIYTRNSKHFRPVGRVYARVWKNPDSPPEDLTPTEREELARKARTELADDNGGSQEENPEEYIFFIESIIQASLKVGMKVEATIHKMNSGIMFFDEVTMVFPSFDTYLPNEPMAQWKKPRAMKGAFDFVPEDDGLDPSEAGSGAKDAGDAKGGEEDDY